MYWSEQSFTGIEMEDQCSLSGLFIELTWSLCNLLCLRYTYKWISIRECPGLFVFNYGVKCVGLTVPHVCACPDQHEFSLTNVVVFS